MAIGLDDALLGWLVASAGTTLRDQLRGGRARRAMRQLVATSVAATVAAVADHLDDDQAEHLRSVLREREAPVSGAKVSSPTELAAALRAWTAALDHAEFGEPGYLMRLGIDADRLGEELADRVAAGIRAHGRTGGPLRLVAERLWRDELTHNIGEIRRDLSQLRHTRGPPISYGGGLPGVTPEFVGRRQALATLAERVEAHDPAGIVVAIHAVDGMAGVGKTELALHAAHQHQHRYPDGQYFINLYGYTEGIPPIPTEAALEELLRQAGVAPRDIPPDLPGRQARWRTLMAPRRALVVLDNALDVDQVRALLPMSAGCLVLVTSRSRLLGLPGGKSLWLDVLPQSDAVELFTRLADADAHLGASVARVVDLVGCLPVAVRAVAGQVDEDYTVSELADDLARAKAQTGLVDQLGQLGAGVRAAFETSLLRLDESDQRAFRLLGAHPGPVIGVPQFAALAELPTADAQQILRGLAGRNLLTPAGWVGHRRYELHDLLREFARQQVASRLSVEQRSAAITGLITWYATVMSFLERLWDGNSEVAGSEVAGLSLTGLAEASAWLAGEQDNLLALATVATGPAAANVCHRSARLLAYLSHYLTAGTLHQRAVDLHRRTGNRHEEADALTGLGHVDWTIGDYSAANEHFRAALAICQQIGNRRGEADALTGLGIVAKLSGDYPAAGTHLRAALAIWQQVGKRPGVTEVGSHASTDAGEAGALWALAEVALNTGDYAAAERISREAVAIRRQTGNRNGESGALSSLGHAVLATGNHSQAGRHFRAALALAQQVGNRGRQAWALYGLGEVARVTSDLPAATERFNQAIAIYLDIGNPTGKSYPVNGLGQVALAIGDHAAAAERFREALILSRQTGSRYRETYALTGLGQVALATRAYAVAGERFREALAICQRAGIRPGEANALQGLGHLANLEGRGDEARDLWQRALAILLELGSPHAGSVRELLEPPARG